MSDVISIDLKRTGFPVKIGEIELFFDASYENLATFFDVEEIARKKLKEAEDKIKHIHFPAELSESNDISEIDTKNVHAAFDYKKEEIAINYDVVFGDGAFKKIYEKYPDILALETAMDPLFTAIDKRIIEYHEERTSEVEDIKAKYLDKKKNIKK